MQSSDSYPFWLHYCRAAKLSFSTYSHATRQYRDVYLSVGYDNRALHRGCLEGPSIWHTIEITHGSFSP